MIRNWKQKLSLTSRGARYQTVIAALLMSLLPILLIWFVALTNGSPAGTYTFASKALIVSLALLLALSGYLIFYKYALNIIKLRHYLKKIAEGELPEAIALLDSEDDIKAIEGYLNTVLAEMRKKMALLQEQLRLTRDMKNAIESQQQELLEAERYRVMIQSLGAACHHIGQPTTILTAHLYFLKAQAVSPKEQLAIDECAAAVDAISDVLDKLRRVSEYRTVPYRTFYQDNASGADREILDIDNPGHDQTLTRSDPSLCPRRGRAAC